MCKEIHSPPEPRRPQPEVAFRISGTAMRLLVQSDLYRDPRKYDGGTNSARDA